MAENAPKWADSKIIYAYSTLPTEAGALARENGRIAADREVYGP